MIQELRNRCTFEAFSFFDRLFPLSILGGEFRTYEEATILDDN